MTHEELRFAYQPHVGLDFAPRTARCARAALRLQRTACACCGCSGGVQRPSIVTLALSIEAGPFYKTGATLATTYSNQHWAHKNSCNDSGLLAMIAIGTWNMN